MIYKLRINTMKKLLVVILAVFGVSFTLKAQVGYSRSQLDTTQRACLFAHMTEADYGRLYYSVSLDGFHWRQINGGKRIKDDYRGHPDIARGRDGRFYLIGNDEERTVVRVWVSTDLTEWKEHSSFVPDMSVWPEFSKSVGGAPKIFFDAAGDQFVITWHTTSQEKGRVPGNFSWANMRTFYVTTKDFRTFSNPKRLFQFDLPTIDVIIRKDGDLYYAILKDEGFVSIDHPTGKTIRISWSMSLDGPWSEPTDKIMPNWCEAPAAIVNPDGSGWLIYAERYSAVRYELVAAPSLKGPYTSPIGTGYFMPPGLKHGGMINITREEYDAIVNKFGF